MFTNLSAHTHQQYPDRHFGDDHQPLSTRFHKECKTTFNCSVCNCMLHPWLLYMSPHIKPVLFSDVGIMPNEYTSNTWIFICNHMCILSCKSGRIYAYVFICIENIYWQNSTVTIITSVYIAPLLTWCSLVQWYFISVLFFFSPYFTLSFQRCFRNNIYANFSPSLAIDLL